MDIRQLSEEMHRFVTAKGWYEADSPRPQTPRNIATSLAIEAAEVLEHFQWDETVADRAELASELADVTLYLLQLASHLPDRSGASGAGQVESELHADVGSMSRFKILAVTDQVVDSLHSPNVKNRFGDVDLIISCGDLPYGYLDYLVTVLGKPLYFVHGNHDRDYEYTETGRRYLAPQGATVDSICAW